MNFENLKWLRNTIICSLFSLTLYAQSKVDFPLVTQNAEVFSNLTWQQARTGVPEITLIKKKEEPLVFTGKHLELVNTAQQRLESPSRTTRSNGKYHTWIMQCGAVNLGKSEEINVYITSKDGINWNVEGGFPNGDKGSMDENWREGIQVVKFEGKYWMFYTGNSTNPKYNANREGTINTNRHGICLMVADRPEGPWKYAVDEPIISRSDNKNDWDYSAVNNPYPVYFKGKWYVYYKAFNFEKTGIYNTLNGVAVADKITGPYKKFEGNPVCDAHGSFAWAYRGGVTLIAFGEGFGKIHWSPDGLHFKNVDNPRSRGVYPPMYCALYIPNDPLNGEPITNKEQDELWGLEPKINIGGNIQDAVWPMVKGTLTFNPVRKEIFTPELINKIKAMGSSEMHPIYYREVFGNKKLAGDVQPKVVPLQPAIPPPYDYPTEAVCVPLIGQIFSGLTWEQARKGVPEIKLISKKEEEITYTGLLKDAVNDRVWKESPSRIIYHNGKYHAWFMHLNVTKGRNEMGFDPKNFYVTSTDGYNWEVMCEMQNGEKGSFDDLWREGLQVVKYDNKFWMFYAGNTSDNSLVAKGKSVSGIGLLVADKPDGPWKRAVDKPLFARSSNPNDWDYDQVNNPYPVYFNNKWYIYYKGSNVSLNGTGRTWQGVAVSDNITGPYTKYEGNPICDGHGSFAWNFRGGVTMLPFGYDLTEGRIHWSPDGLHFHNVDAPLDREIKSPIFSSFYLPNDPLSGTVVTDKEPDEIWGLETKQAENAQDWKLVHGTVKFNSIK